MNASNLVRTALVGAALAVPAAMGSGLHAQQLDWSSASTVETAGDDLTLIYTSVSVKPDGLGLKPVASLSLYRLETAFDGTWSATPAVGLEYRAPGGLVSGKVGYSFKDQDSPIPFFGGGSSGVSTSAHGEYWGDGRVGLQGLASYNWGSEYLWSRGRATTRIAEVDAGWMHLGGEYVWQGELDAPPLQEKYESTQYGPVLQFISRGGGPIVVLGGGWKQVPGDDTWYAKAELVLSL